MSRSILESPVIGTNGPMSPSRAIASFEGIEDEDDFFFAIIFQNSNAISSSLFDIFQSITLNSWDFFWIIHITIQLHTKLTNSLIEIWARQGLTKLLCLCHCSAQTTVLLLWGWTCGKCNPHWICMFGLEILSSSLFPHGYPLWPHGIKIAQ
jgi:hypothetical protein